MAENAQFTKWNIKFCQGILYLNLVLVALRLGLPSSPIEIYVTIGLGLSVSENEIYVTLVLRIFVWENCTWPIARNDPEEMCGYTQPTLGPSQGMIQRRCADTPNLHLAPPKE